MFFVFLGLAIADLLFLGVWTWLGFGVDADPARAERHQIGGLMVCILTCFVHAVTFVYFLGTGLAIKEARRNWGIALDYVRHTRRYKLVAYPIAMFSIALIIATGIVGGAVRSGSASPLLHRGLALAAMVSSAIAFAIAARTILRNGFMMGLVRGDIARIREATRHEPLAETGTLPELLRDPDEVRKPPRGFLVSRAFLFLGLSAALLFAYLRWFLHVPWVNWVPFTVLAVAMVVLGVYLKIRHPLPADVDF